MQGSRILGGQVLGRGEGEEKKGELKSSKDEGKKGNERKRRKEKMYERDRFIEE